MLSYDLTVAVEGQSDLYVQLLVCMCNEMFKRIPVILFSF